jgi:hypothetical protein
VKLPRPEGWGFASRAYAPGKENKHFHMAPLDPVLKDGRSALRQHFVRGERAGQEAERFVSQRKCIGKDCTIGKDGIGKPCGPRRLGQHTSRFNELSPQAIRGRAMVPCKSGLPHLY